MQRRSDKTTRIEKREVKGLKAGDLAPGQCVSVDQFISTERGRLPHTQGKEPEHKRYSGGTIFCDHASGYISVQPQVYMTGKETVDAKTRFEREAYQHGVMIDQYHADNGIFKSNEFVKSLEERSQPIDYCGVGAHHQNGVAEGAIRIVTDRARTLLIHAAVHWPETVSMDLWPFAMEYAVHIYNQTPNRKSHLSPLELFLGSKLPNNGLDLSRVWGCPTYVLEAEIQNGMKKPRWKRRSKVGQFLGVSKHHAGTVALVRNLQTGYVSPQFHVVFDELFETVYNGGGVTPERWQRLDIVNYAPADEEQEIRNPDTPKDTDGKTTESAREGGITPPTEGASIVVPEGAPVSSPEGAVKEEDTTTSTMEFLETLPEIEDVPEHEEPTEVDSDDEEDDNPQLRSSAEDNIPSRPRRRAAEKSWKNKYDEKVWTYAAVNANVLANHSRVRPSLDRHDIFLATLNHEADPIGPTALHYANIARLNTDPDTGWVDDIEPLAFSAKANDNDTPNYWEAMNGPDQAGFREAMNVEWRQLQEKETWDVVDRSEAIRLGKSIVGVQWAFKRKRFPDGTVKKLKARLVVRGDQHVKGIDYFDVFAPVVSWSTVRTMLTLSCALGLQSKQIDYTLAFCQASLEEPIYVEMPASYKIKGKILKLKKSLYGLHVAPRLFFDTMSAGLENLGFVPSKYDPCLFINKTTGTILITYVDDCIFFSKNMKDIDDAIDNISKDFDLTIEDDVAGFLGIDLQYREDGSIQFRQDGLVDRVVTALGLEPIGTKTEKTPTNMTPLGTDKDGEPFGESFNYRSVVGMMLYLSSNAFPEIGFAVNQCARFVQSPTMKHGTALKRIGKYLLGVKGNGLIINPDQSLRLEMYADADFAGLWGHEDPTDPISVRSRTGYVITLGGAPIVWGSKLQTECALSTMMAEYIALSYTMRILLPVKNVIDELTEVLEIERETETIVHEDNAGCLALATLKQPQVTPASKFYAIKLHWFKEQLRKGPKGIWIEKVETDSQKADLWTKPFAAEKFLQLRKLVCGW